MHQLDVPHTLGVLVAILAAAKLFGALAQRLGQPAVLGELIAGVLLGKSLLGWVDRTSDVFHVLSELGILILLFEIGLETDIRKLVKVGGASTAVAFAGVVLPFTLGYTVCWFLGTSGMVAIVAGATLTATSVGITARVLSDLNRLQDAESQIILGAAVIDDVVGLIILAVVGNLTQGEAVTILGVFRTSAIAFGFLGGVLVIGRFLLMLVSRTVPGARPFGTPTMLALILAFGLAWFANAAGSAMILGAFAAGLLLHGTPSEREIGKGVAHLGHFFVPIFFVTVGAAVDLRVLSPFVAANRPTLLVGGLLIVAAVAGKFAAGYAPFWFQGNKKVIGVGMIPRGEVGLIFAQMGLASGVFDDGLFSAATLMVMVTTFLAPPLLKMICPARPPGLRDDSHDGIEVLVTEA